MQDMRRKRFTQIYRDLYGDATGAHPDGLQHGGRKPAETSVTEFCYKSVKFSLQEFKNIKIILFLIQELLKQLNSPK